MNRWQKHFPFPSPRSEQAQAIDFAIDAFESGKRVVIAELPVGIGKSAIAITLSRYFHDVKFESSYLLTTQKLLQQQYMRDFESSGLVQLKSASAYTCKAFDNQVRKSSCADVQKLLKSKSKTSLASFSQCQGSGCRYAQAKQEFFDASEGVTNYAYFLATNAYSHQKIPPRQFIIMDEGHNIESVVDSFVKIAFSNHFYKNVLKVRTPPVDATQEKVHKWLVETCAKKLKKVIADNKLELKSFDPESTQALELSKTIDELEKGQNRIEYFKHIYDPSTWVLDVAKTDKRGERIYEFKPLDVSSCVRNLLLTCADKILILSATIVDVNMFCRLTGIKDEEMAYITLPSPFPVENRPVHFMPVGSMSKKNIESTLPVLTETVREILKQHADDKGIIHCTTFRIAKHLMQSLNDPRLLIHDSSDRDAVLKYHKESIEPTVILSPSMTEGIDLSDDDSRFQVICKVPFPYLGDIAVKRKMERNGRWYDFQTVKTIVQALGRSVRNEQDHAMSYILDSDWARFYRANRDMFPTDFDKVLKH